MKPRAKRKFLGDLDDAPGGVEVHVVPSTYQGSISPCREPASESGVDLGAQKTAESPAAVAQGVEGVESELVCNEEDNIDGQLEKAGMALR